MVETSDSLSILEFLRELIANSTLRDLFQERPEAALAQYGLSDLDAGDVNDALVLLDDSQTADFSRDYDGSPRIDFSGAKWGSGDHDHNGDDGDDGDTHSEAVHQLSRFITNNFVTDNDTIVDNSTNQQVDTGGGDFEQSIDIDQAVASGDGALAVGGDVDDSTLTSGDDNVIGDDNISGNGNAIGDGATVLSGDGNTAAFGSGDAGDTTFGDVSADHGSALSAGDGDTEGGFSATDSFNDTDVETTTTTENDDSFNNSFESSTETDSDTTTTTTVDSNVTNENHVLSDNQLDLDVNA